jgi:hypothetical protein
MPAADARAPAPVCPVYPLPPPQVANYASIATNCNCQRSTCGPTCNDICLECPAGAANNSYLIPLAPSKAATTALAAGDNNYGDGIALNGVPLTKADPLVMLSNANNPAPLDWYGGHATLQYVYHFHAIPTNYFTCATGWDATHHVWAPAAPDGAHSPLIGWALDGYPVYGPYTTGGVVPVVGGPAATDTDACYGHTENGSYHYHSRDVHDGRTHAFLGCFAGKTAVLPGAPAAATPAGDGMGGGGGGAGGGAAPAACSVTYGSKPASTQRCCGDMWCDSPMETAANCAADCASAGRRLAAVLPALASLAACPSVGTCPAQTVVASHTTPLGAALPAYSASACAASSAAAYVSAYTVPCAAALTTGGATEGGNTGGNTGAEAANTSAVVYVSGVATLTGYTAATFDTAARAAFVSGVATLLGVQSSAVTITALARRRALLVTGSVSVSFAVATTAGASAALSASITSGNGNSGVLLAALQAAGLSSLTGVSVAASSSTSTAQPTALATTPSSGGARACDGTLALVAAAAALCAATY